MFINKGTMSMTHVIDMGNRLSWHYEAISHLIDVTCDLLDSGTVLYMYVNSVYMHMCIWICILHVGNFVHIQNELY